MTTPKTNPHVRIDPRFGFSRLSTDNPERDMFASLAEQGRHDDVRAIMESAVLACRQHMEKRHVALLLRGAETAREQAI